MRIEDLRDRVCVDCSRSYKPTGWGQKRCSACGPAAIRAADAAWRKRNAESFREKRRAYYHANKKKKREYERSRRRKDINFRLAFNLRRRVNKILKGQKNGSAVDDLGCSVVELRGFLEAQFQPGMTWDNYGAWEIDHIRPLSSFDLTDRTQFLEACNYSNLQPLWKAQNRAKGAKVQ